MHSPCQRADGGAHNGRGPPEGIARCRTLNIRTPRYRIQQNLPPGRIASAAKHHGNGRSAGMLAARQGCACFFLSHDRFRTLSTTTITLIDPLPFTTKRFPGCFVPPVSPGLCKHTCPQSACKDDRLARSIPMAPATRKISGQLAFCRSHGCESNACHQSRETNIDFNQVLGSR